MGSDIKERVGFEDRAGYIRNLYMNMVNADSAKSAPSAEDRASALEFRRASLEEAIKQTEKLQVELPDCFKNKAEFLQEVLDHEYERFWQRLRDCTFAASEMQGHAYLLLALERFIETQDSGDA